MTGSDKVNNGSKIDDYYVPKDMAIAKTIYLDTIQNRNRNFLLSLPIGLGLTFWNKAVKKLGSRPGVFLVGSLISFAMIDYANDLEFNTITNRLNTNSSI